MYKETNFKITMEERILVPETLIEWASVEWKYWLNNKYHEFFVAIFIIFTYSESNEGQSLINSSSLLSSEMICLHAHYKTTVSLETHTS